MSKPLILISNDDSIEAPGLKYLVNLLKDFNNVVVVAPKKRRSGQSHAISIDEPIFIERIYCLGEGIESYICSGTPVDCVKIALNRILKQKPDLCVCGINHGPNVAINTIYSGTMSASMEGAIKDIPSIGFSISDYEWNCDFSEVDKFVVKIVKKTLQEGLPWGTALNINFPKKNKNPYKGIKICRQGKSNWKEQFEKRQDPSNRDYYWLHGNFENLDTNKDTDIMALEKNYVSVVPVQCDLTCISYMETLKTWKL